MKTIPFIFDTLEKAHVPITDFALMTNISRQTLHHWKAGGAINDQIRLSIAYNWATRLSALVQAKKLPLTEGVPSAERIQIIRRLIVRG